MTKNLLLSAIALGLWANAAATWVRPSHAQSSYVEAYLAQIAMSTSALAQGGANCNNSKICD